MARVGHGEANELSARSTNVSTIYQCFRSAIALPRSTSPLPAAAAAAAAATATQASRKQVASKVGRQLLRAKCAETSVSQKA